MNIDFVTMSSKGQIVIPVEMRDNFEQGEQILLMKSGNQIIMKKSSEVEEKFKEDLEFARRTEEALKRFEKHPEEFKSMEFDDFIEELKKW